jgi:hypothetical protein
MIEQQIRHYTWRACYGQSELDELDAPHGFSNVDTSQVMHLDLLDQTGRAVYVMQVPLGAQAIFRRRRQQAISAQSEEVLSQQTIHIIGWQSPESAAYLFLFEDGSVLLSSDFQAV